MGRETSTFQTVECHTLWLSLSRFSSNRLLTEQHRGFCIFDSLPCYVTLSLDLLSCHTYNSRKRRIHLILTGLVAQQQCVGPLHTPLADYALVTLSFFDTTGSATSIGEQPIKGLISEGANARMSVAEALTNLCFVAITELKDVKCSGNWMWPAKLPGNVGHLFVDNR